MILQLPLFEHRKRKLPKPKRYGGKTGPWKVVCDRCLARGDNTPWKFIAASPYIVIAKFRDHLEQEHDLECAFCYLKFANFKLLAEHVTDAHVSSTAREERLQREAWHPLDDLEKESDDMALPAPGGSQAGNQGRRGGSSGGGARKPPAVPFLKVEDFNAGEKQIAKVLGVSTQQQGFNDLIVKVSMKGKAFFLGLKTSNPNYEILFDAFGSDENDWVGKEFEIGLNFNEFFEKSFVHIFKAPAGEVSGRKGRKSA